MKLVKIYLWFSNDKKKSNKDKTNKIKKENEFFCNK